MYKKTLLFLTLSIISFVSAFGQNWAELSNQGAKFYQKGEYQQAIELLQQANDAAKKEFGNQHENYTITLNNLASVHQKLAHYSVAEKLFIELLEVEKKRVGNKSLDYGLALNNLGGLYYTLDKLEQAEPLFLQALAIDEGFYGKTHPTYAISLNNLGRLYAKVGKYQKAKSLFIQALAINKKHFGANKWDELNDMGLFAEKQADYTTALKFWKEGITQAENEFGKKHQNYVINLNNLGSVYQKLEQYLEAEKYYTQAMEILKEHFEESTPTYNITLGNLAGLYEDLGAYQKSEKFYLEAIQSKKKVFGESHISVANISNNLALLYQKLGRYSEAEKLFQKACLIGKREGANGKANYATFLNTLATLYLTMGKLSEAEPLYIESKKLRKEEFGEKNLNYGYSLTGLGLLYRRMGRFSEAETLFLEAKDIFKTELGENTILYAGACNNLAGLYLFMDKHEDAEKLFLETKEIWKVKLGEKHSSYATILTNIGLLYQKKEKYSEAEKLYLEAKEIWENQNQETFTSLFGYLGSLYQSMDNYQEAEKYYLKAKEINKIFLGEKHISYAQHLNGLAYLYEKMNQYSKAEVLHKEVNEIIFTQIEHNFAFLSEKEKNQYLQTLAADKMVFNSFVLNYLDEKPHLTAQMYANTLFLKGLLFLSSKKIRTLILDSKDQKLKEEYEDWTQKRQLLAHIYTLPLKEREKKAINIEALELEINKLEKELNIKSAAFAKTQSKTRYTWKDVKKRLKKGEAAIEIIRIRHLQKDMTGKIKYLALIIKSDTQKYPEYVLLENGKELEKKYLKYYRNAIEFKIEDDKSYEQYWSKIASKLQGIKKVYLSADGVYHSLSLASLQNPISKNYLHDELDIELLIGTKELVSAQKTSKSKNKAQLFGYPNYTKFMQQNEHIFPSQDTTKRFLNSERIVSLPATKIEVTNIATILEKAGFNAEVHLETKASEQKIKELNRPNILHIATHGFFLEDVESKADESGKVMGVSHEKVIENPLFRSGLLFAGAQQAINEGGTGVLTAYEAANLKLEGTELLVLSACQTGLGEIKNGEGVYGLQRAFQTAGAKTILMSLWSVSDQVTQELMSLFYQNWLIKKETKREAFKNAQNEIKNKYPEPYFWAAFVMIGE
jgi:CHAT domain-containing protein/Flp pilus assembly protein TadD